jgi:MFS family permease
MHKKPAHLAHHSFTALLTVCCLVTFGCYFAISMRLPVVPLYAGGFGVSTSQIGLINAAFYLMAGLLALPSGILSDRLGRKRLAVFCIIVLFTGMLLLYFSRSFFYCRHLSASGCRHCRFRPHHDVLGG